MDVVRVARGHQATVPSRGANKPAASPTFRLLGARQAKDGRTWDEHYKQALAKLGQVREDDQVRQILELVMQDPRFRPDPATGISPDQFVGQLLKDPARAARVIAAYSTQHDLPYGRQIAASLDPSAVPELPQAGAYQFGGGLSTNLRDRELTAANAVDLATTFLPVKTRGLREAVQYGPTAGSLYAASAPPVLQRETVHRLAPLFQLADQRAKLAPGSPEAAALDKQIAETEASLGVPTGTTRTWVDEATSAGAGAVGQVANTANSALMGPLAPLLLPALHPGMVTDPEKRPQLATSLGAQYANLLAMHRGNVPLNQLLQRQAWADAGRTSIARGILPAIGERGVLRGLGGSALRAARATPLASTIMAGGEGAYQAVAGQTPKGQQELVDRMVDYDRVDRARPPLGQLMARVGNVVKGPFVGFDDAQAATALDLADATGQVPDDVADSRKAVADQQQWAAQLQPLRQGFHEMFPQLTPQQNEQLALRALERRWEAEHGGTVDPAADEQKVDELLTAAQQQGLLAQPLTEREVLRMKDVARATGVTGVVETFFPRAYDQAGNEAGVLPDVRAFKALTDSTVKHPVLPPTQFDYLNDGRYVRPAAQAAPAVQAPKPQAPAAGAPTPPEVGRMAGKTLDFNLDQSRLRMGELATQHAKTMDDLHQQGLQRTSADVNQFTKSVQQQAAAPVKPLALPPPPVQNSTSIPT